MFTDFDLIFTNTRKKAHVKEFLIINFCLAWNNVMNAENMIFFSTKKWEREIGKTIWFTECIREEKPRFNFVKKPICQNKIWRIFPMKTLLRCILLPPKNMCQILLQLFILWLLWLQFKTKTETKYPQFNIYKNRKEKTNVMSRFRSKIKGLLYYYIHVWHSQKIS